MTMKCLAYTKMMMMGSQLNLPLVSKKTTK